MPTVKEILTIKRFERRRESLQKSAAQGAGSAKGKSLVVKLGAASGKGAAPGANQRPIDPMLPKAPDSMQAPYAAAGGFVRVQRPNLHAAPILAQLVSHGKHGIQAVDSNGTRIKVRHEHVLERDVMPTADERAQHLTTLARRGAPVDASERFLTPDTMGKVSTRPTEAQIGLLTEIARHGTPIDLARLQAEGTQDDVHAILRRFVNDPHNLVTKAK
jgi:hypothetical protein